MMDLSTLEQMVTIAGGFAAVFHFAVLRPLNNTIVRLDATTQRLGEQIDRSDQRRHQLEIKLATVDQSVKAAHQRLDTFAEFCRDTHHDTMPIDIYTAIGPRRKIDQEAFCALRDHCVEPEKT